MRLIGDVIERFLLADREGSTNACFAEKMKYRDGGKCAFYQNEINRDTEGNPIHGVFVLPSRMFI